MNVFGLNRNTNAPCKSRNGLVYDCSKSRSGASNNAFKGTHWHALARTDTQCREAEAIASRRLHLRAGRIGQAAARRSSAFSLQAFLPASSLERLLAAQARFPLTLRVSGTAYVSVREFTAAEGVVELPDALFEVLGICDGDEVLLELVDLAAGVSVKLRALEPSWLLIPAAERDALLEFALRKRQFLQKGENLTLDYLGERYSLSVVDCKPDDLIAITDTDLVTEFDEPEESLPALPVLDFDEAQTFDLESSASTISQINVVDVNSPLRLSLK